MVSGLCILSFFFKCYVKKKNKIKKNKKKQKQKTKNETKFILDRIWVFMNKKFGWKLG